MSLLETSSFTVFLKQRQISGRHYTELLNVISRACGASFAEIIISLGSEFSQKSKMDQRLILLSPRW